MNNLAALLFKAMVALVPLQTHSYIEPEAVSKARYESIASDIAEVAEQEPSPFANDDKKVKIALFLVIVSSTESRWEGDVDKCIRGGDHNTSWTIFQLSNAWAPKYKVCSDRKEAVRYAIRAINNSFKACSRLDYYSRMSGYDTGRCIANESISVRRLRKLDKFLKDYSTDIDAL